MVTNIQLQYVGVLTLFIMGAVFVVLFKALSFILAPRRKYDENKSDKLSVFVAYECGEVPIGTGQDRFNFQYYIFGLVFVIFDVVTGFLFTWALILRETKMFGFIIAVIFLGILLIGFGYWSMRDKLRWM